MIEERSICTTTKFGNKIWRNKAGELHRLNDLPAAIHADGTQEWCVDGKLHRLNGKPAVIYADGSQLWYVDGKRHRINGKPAIVWVDGYPEWWINENDITEQVLAWHKTNNIKYPLATPEEEEDLAVLFNLTFG